MTACLTSPLLCCCAVCVQGELADRGFNAVGRVVAASAVSKKPTDAELLAFLQPVVDVLQEAQKPEKPGSAFVNHQKAFEEGVASLQWPTVSPPNGLPKDIAQSGYEAADFWLIKILKEGKEKGGKQGEDCLAFASTWKQLLVKQTEFVKQHAKSGLDWKVGGQPLSAYSGGGSSTAPAAPGAPPAPSFSAQASSAASSAATAVAGGMGSVFGQLSSLGDSVTGGLKKVTSDMKTKNIKDKDPLQPKSSAVAPSSSAGGGGGSKTAGKVQGEPKTYNSKGRWMVEYYSSGGPLTISELELKDSVYILGCSNVTVRVPKKCKSIQIDSCKKLTVEFAQVVSILEVVNSERVNIHVSELCPSISIDKSDGVAVHLSTLAVKSPPQIITSKVSELNLVIPGKTEDDDPVEIPLPEQYITTYEGNGKIKTESVAHSAN